MKMFFTRSDIDELKTKVEKGLKTMEEYPPENNSAGEGVLYAFKSFHIALKNLDN